MPNSLHIQYKIGDIIDDILENWDDENYRVTIESFKRKKDCLVLFKIGNWGEKNIFFQIGCFSQRQGRQELRTVSENC